MRGRQRGSAIHSSGFIGNLSSCHHRTTRPHGSITIGECIKVSLHRILHATESADMSFSVESIVFFSFGGVRVGDLPAVPPVTSPHSRTLHETHRAKRISHQTTSSIIYPSQPRELTTLWGRSASPLWLRCLVSARHAPLEATRLALRTRAYLLAQQMRRI